MARAGEIDAVAETTADGRGHGVALGEAVRTWGRIAALSFGGPAGQIAVMHRILVEEKRWIGEERFLHALNYCMLLPGPEAQQLAVYIGWLMHRTLGGLIAGILFVLPGVVAIMVLSWIYAAFGNVGVVQALFFGLKAAVLAVVLDAVVRIGKRALKNRVMIGIAAAAFVAIFAFGVPFPLIILTAGLIGFAGGRLGHPAFQVGGGHGKAGAGKTVADADTRLAELPLAGSDWRLVPLFDAAALRAFRGRIEASMGDELETEYLSALRDRTPVQVNEALLPQVAGGMP